jgi:hypothetical protein
VRAGVSTRPPKNRSRFLILFPNDAVSKRDFPFAIARKGRAKTVTEAAPWPWPWRGLGANYIDLNRLKSTHADLARLRLFESGFRFFQE